MVKEEKIKKENKIEIKATPRAYEKLKEIVNGSRKKVNEFIEKISKEGIHKEDYLTFLRNKQQEFYYYKCNNVYVIFTIEENILTLVDFLIEIEFKEITNRI